MHLDYLFKKKNIININVHFVLYSPVLHQSETNLKKQTHMISGRMRAKKLQYLGYSFPLQGDKDRPTKGTLKLHHISIFARCSLSSTSI